MTWQAESRRRLELPANWPQLVALVKARDGGRCTWVLPSGLRCPRPASDVDHIRRGGDHSLQNLRCLCVLHHRRKTALEGVEARRGPKPRKRVERHPLGG